MKRIRVGAYPIASLADAREKAQDILRDIQLGLLRQGRSEPDPSSLPLGDVIMEFIKKQAKRQSRDLKEPAAYCCA